jgi:hypothetical protein
VVGVGSCPDFDSAAESDFEPGLGLGLELELEIECGLEPELGMGRVVGQTRWDYRSFRLVGRTTYPPSRAGYAMDPAFPPDRGIAPPPTTEVQAVMANHQYSSLFKLDKE